jgi:hypothetical protein
MAGRTRPRLDDTQGQLRELRQCPTRLAYRLQSLLEDVLIRLERRLRREGHEWDIPEDYLRGVSTTIQAGCRLLKEVRALTEAYKADGLTDEEITESLKKHLIRELTDMDDAEFLGLLEAREGKGGGGAATPAH